MTLFYRVCHFIFYPLMWLLFPFTFHGRENVPKDRAALFCANHAHAMDPFLLALGLPRTLPIRFMAKKELMELPFVGWLIRSLGAYGVDRGHSDTKALKTSIQSLRDGVSLLVFPEGTRVRRQGETRAKRGAVVIAAHTGAPVVPVYVGTPRKLFHMTHIVFGEPFEGTSALRHGTAEAYQEYADRIMRRVYELGREFEKR